MRENEIGLQRSEFLRESLHQLGVERGPAIVEPDIAALRPPEFLESLLKFGDYGLSFPIAPSIRHQHADPPHALGLLRPRRERPRRRRAAEQRDELAALHSITSSALNRTEVGSSRPSDLAVLRLTTSSTLVGCWTGKSAGLGPFEILAR